MKKAKYFKLYELLPKEMYKDEEQGWELFDPKLIDTIDAIRELLGVPLIVNSWYWGQDRRYSGYRPENCPIGVKNSTHKQGKAADMISAKMPAAKMREIIEKNADKLPCPIRIERGVTWLHVDVKTILNAPKITYFNP